MHHKLNFVKETIHYIYILLFYYIDYDDFKGIWLSLWWRHFDCFLLYDSKKIRISIDGIFYVVGSFKLGPVHGLIHVLAVSLVCLFNMFMINVSMVRCFPSLFIDTRKKYNWTNICTMLKVAISLFTDLKITLWSLIGSWLSLFS